ncbi:protein kinase superfamily protein [Striga asiatica]|uniref:non-specific serine/threonine protein kinase n=1 Tax=Striga asiatica TaxID=4170 RepID=A0A5A7P7A3_STRAF|nr:protein kinase superfamily protein [Striga asiatica]
MGGSGFNFDWSQRTHIFHLKVWVLVTVFLGISLALLVFLLLCYIALRKSREKNGTLPVRLAPHISREIKEIDMDQNSATTRVHNNYMYLFNFHEKDSDKLLNHFKNEEEKNNNDGSRQSDSSFNYLHETSPAESGEKKMKNSSPLMALPELSHLDWGHWFTLRDLEVATNKFSKENIIGEGGYGIVYRGQLANGTIVAVKRLLNNLGQAEKEFRVEVEAIGHVRHKNLVRLLGYCVEGTHRLLVYEYVNNGNLEQWLHGGMAHLGHLTWEGRMKILIGTAKALAYLHDAIEPKVVHRDIKASNILIDDDFNAKISDFGLAKLLGAGKSHIFTRVMGTFGYVAPEYASSGYLNEKSDVYSFGVLLLEAITGRDPVDDTRPVHEKNLVDWLKLMVGERRSEEVVDPNMKSRPPTSSLKRALLTALRCVDPNAEQRPTMSQVVRMLESEEYPIPREGRRVRKEKQEKI